MDFYNEDGDSNIDYSNQGDFYAGNAGQVRPTSASSTKSRSFHSNNISQQPELEFQTFHESETTGVPQPDTGDIELEDLSDTTQNPSETTVRVSFHFFNNFPTLISYQREHQVKGSSGSFHSINISQM